MKKLVLFLVVLLCVLCMVAGESASPEYLADDAIESMQEELLCNDFTFADTVGSIIGSVRRSGGIHLRGCGRDCGRLFVRPEVYI